MRERKATQFGKGKNREGTMEQSLEIQAREIQNLPLAEKQEKALDAVSEFASLTRRTVEQGWLAGTFLKAIKSELGHRNWLPWLRDNGIKPRTAQRFMKLATVEIREIVAFDSMAAALEALKPDPLTKQKEAVIKHHLAFEEILPGAAREFWRLGESLTKGVELGGERAIDTVIKENSMPRSLIVAARDIYERHSLEGINELPIEELRALVLSQTHTGGSQPGFAS